MKELSLIFAGLCLSLFLYAFAGFKKPFNKNIQQENQAPVVKIISPQNNTAFDAGSQVNYEIGVADKEDGDSQYDEINAKEVLLQVRYMSNKAKLQAVLNKGTQSDEPGIAVMRTSNCFNCHSFNNKLIGPSFYDIGKRYAATAANITLLANRVRNGSTGVWGKEVMPTHPELSADEINSTVQWILKNATDPAVSYYIGLKGAIIFNAPVAAAKKGTYVLTASYVDHGINGSGKHLEGHDAAVVRTR
jgi:cytochrome c